MLVIIGMAKNRNSKLFSHTPYSHHSLFRPLTAANALKSCLPAAATWVIWPMAARRGAAESLGAPRIHLLVAVDLT